MGVWDTVQLETQTGYCFPCNETGSAAEIVFCFQEDEKNKTKSLIVNLNIAF